MECATRHFQLFIVGQGRSEAFSFGGWGGGRKAFLRDILYLKILKRMVQEFKNIQNL